MSCPAVREILLVAGLNTGSRGYMCWLDVGMYVQGSDGLPTLRARIPSPPASPFQVTEPQHAGSLAAATEAALRDSASPVSRVSSLGAWAALGVAPAKNKLVHLPWWHLQIVAHQGVVSGPVGTCVQPLQI